VVLRTDGDPATLVNPARAGEDVATRAFHPTGTDAEAWSREPQLVRLVEHIPGENRPRTGAFGDENESRSLAERSTSFACDLDEILRRPIGHVCVMSAKKSNTAPASREISISRS